MKALINNCDVQVHLYGVQSVKFQAVLGQTFIWQFPFIRVLTKNEFEGNIQYFLFKRSLNSSSVINFFHKK